MPYFTPRLLGPKPWGEELLVASTDAYTGKMLTMRAGESGPLQYHVKKDETMYLVDGEAELTLEEHGALVKATLKAGDSYHVPPLTIHRVKAVTRCVFFEASTPAFDDRVNVEDRFRHDPNF